MARATVTAAPPVAPGLPLDFDERLALAVLAVDARIDSQPFDLADVIRAPALEPEPLEVSPPFAAVLRRARARLLRDGWTTGHCRTSQAKCAYEAIRLEAESPGQAADACAILLDAIRAEFPHALTVPDWNDQQTNSGPVLRMLDRAAASAEQQGI